MKKIKRFFFFILLLSSIEIVKISADINSNSAAHYLLACEDYPYQFLSPLPNSTSNNAYSTIIINQGTLIDKSSLSENNIIVKGSKSGKASGKLVLSDDQKTIIFKPENKFLPEEIIEVSVLKGIKTIDGNYLPQYKFVFTIEPDNNKTNSAYYPIERSNDPSYKSKSLKKYLPKIRTNILNESALSEGKIFLSAYGVINGSFQSPDTVTSSVMVVNNDGTIFYSKNIGTNKGAGLTDFKMHSNGLMSYPKVIKNYQWTGGAEVIHMIMDESFSVVDSFQMGNGYTAETHDFQMLPNGHVLIMGYYLVSIDLSQVVQGSHPDAYIDGAVIQELDADKNVIFQWRTWDHINVNNIPWNMVPGNTQQIINVFHLNSIRLDNDGGLLLGTPGMGLKVNRQNGEIVWIIGGILNQFTFTNVPSKEALGDFGGHTFQRLGNGNILVFDNSPFPWQPGYGQISSEVVEYSINEENKSAELIWKYIPDSVIPGWHAGSVQRLPNGNTLICWGGPPNEGNSQLPIVTEVTQTKEKVFELFYEGNDLESYRAFRYKLNDGLPNSQITKSEVLALNTYDFNQEGKIDPGISIKINEMSSFGYNEITLKNFAFAPHSPVFNENAPLIKERRIVISNFGIISIDADIRFDINNWNVSDPNETIIYYRETENSGMFNPLPTTYNFVTEKLTAKINGFGEYILGKLDLTSQLIAPIPNFPTNQSEVNYTLPLLFTWSPSGFAISYHLQISQDENFSMPIIDDSSLTTAAYQFAELKADTKYYWRVKTINNAGEGPWCTTQYFIAADPFIRIVKPNGGESWNIGLEYYLEWEDNINEPVNISLFKNESLLSNIIATANSFYLWEIALDFELSNNYKIRISSTLDTNLFDLSDQSFSIINNATQIEEEQSIPVKFQMTQNYPNPFNAETNISFDLVEDNFTYLIIYNSLGQKVKTLVDKLLTKGKYSIKWDASEMSSGIYYYRINSGRNIETKKLILLK